MPARAAGDVTHIPAGEAVQIVTQPLTTLTFADLVLSAAAVSAFFEIHDHHSSATAWLVLFGALLRSKFVLLDRMSPRLPEWIAFAIPSAIFWMLICWLT